MISDRDIEIAKRLSTKYQGASSFGREDAYQACIEGLLKADDPKDEALRVTVMRNEMHRQAVESSYLMRVPWSSWKKLTETPSQVKHTGLSTETLVQYESPAAAISEPGMDAVENKLAWSQSLKGLPQWDVDVLSWAYAQYQQGKRPSGKRFYDFKRAASNLRALLLEGGE